MISLFYKTYDRLWNSGQFPTQVFPQYGHDLFKVSAISTTHTIQHLALKATQLASYINLQRAVSGPSATLTGR